MCAIMAQLFSQLARQKTQAIPKHPQGFLTQRAGKKASQKSQILGWRTITTVLNRQKVRSHLIKLARSIVSKQIKKATHD